MRLKPTCRAHIPTRHGRTDSLRHAFDSRHPSDIDVLLVMLSGRKQFRVAGCTVGSNVAIDHWLMPGDSIFIPALTFHSGGSTASASEESLMLSIAFEPREPSARAHTAKVVDDWRRVRQDLLSQLSTQATATSPRTATSWTWAGTTDGIAALRGAFPAGSSRAALLEPFLPQRPTTRLRAPAPECRLQSGLKGSALLTICTGNRCWRNGAGRLLAAARTHDAVEVRSVGCSGVCPQGAVSVCEGPECAGEALALRASCDSTAATAASAAIDALRCAPTLADQTATIRRA